MTNWAMRFLSMAELVSTWSKDPSTKVGACITQGKRVLSVGFNGFPSGLRDTNLDDREYKYPRMIHAEENAILFAERSFLVESILHTWPLPPCDHCAAIIVAVGIRTVVITDKMHDHIRWGAKFKTGYKILFDGGVDIVVRSDYIIMNDMMRGV